MDNYQKVNWKDRVDSGNKYAIRDNPDGSKAINYVGTVEVHGTEVNAENLNHMDDGIFKNNKEIANRVPMVHLDSVSTSNNLNDLIISSTESESVKIFDSSSTTKSFSNKPIQVNTPFILTVSRIKKSEADTDSVQRQEFTASSNHKTYERFYSSNVWSDWTEVGTGGGGSGGHTYSGIQGIVVDNSVDTIAHTNITTPGTIGSKVGSGSSVIDIGAGDTFTVPYASYDENGHITTQGKGVNTYRLSSSSGGSSYIAGSGIEIQYDASINKSVVSHSNGVEPIDLLGNNTEALAPRPGGKFKVPALTYDTEGHITGAYNTEITLPNEGGGGGGGGTTYYGENDIYVDNTNHTIGHQLGTATQTAGTTDAQEPGFGETFNIPYVKYDNFGHIVSKGTSTVKLPSSGGGGTTYTGEKGITVNNSTNKIGHSNSVSGGSGDVGPTGDISPSAGGSFNVPQINYDDQGHITSATNRVVTLPEGGGSGGPTYTADGGIKITNDTTTGQKVIEHINTVEAGSAGSGGGTGEINPGQNITVPFILWDSNGHIKTSTRSVTWTIRGYEVDSVLNDLTIDGIPGSYGRQVISHTNSVDPGWTGSTEDADITSGDSFRVPAVKIDSTGHVTEVSYAEYTLVGGGSGGTTYTGEKGISVNNSTNKIGHSNSITAGSAGSQGGLPIYPGRSINVPYVEWDSEGHLTGYTTNVSWTIEGYEQGSGITIESVPGGDGAKRIKHSNNLSSGGSAGPGSGTTLDYGDSFDVPRIVYDSCGHITGASTQTFTLPDASGGGGTSYTGRWGIEVTSSYIQHSTSYGGASTLGESGKTITNSTSGGTIKVPYITIDSYGHVTSGSSQNMTIKDPTYNINSQSPGPGGTGGTHHVSPGDGTQIYIPSLAIENSGRISNAYDHCYIIDGPSTMPFTAYGESSSQSQETCVPFTTCTSADNDEYSMRISDRFKFWARRGTLSVPITKVIYDDYSACDSDVPTLVHSETVVTSSSSSTVTITSTSSSQYSGNTRYFSYNSHLFVIITCGIVGILQGYITLDSSSGSGGDGTTLIGVYDGKTLRAKARMYSNKIYIDQPYDTASPSTYPMKGKQWEINVYKV